jgi:hypothetical protein
MGGDIAAQCVAIMIDVRLRCAPGLAQPTTIAIGTHSKLF